MAGPAYRVLGAFLMLSSAATLIAAGTGSAAAEPRNCVIDRWPTGASAHCDGDGYFTVEVDCLGFYFTGGPGIGPYMQTSQRHAYAGHHPEMDPTQTHPVAECSAPLTRGTLGIATGVRVYETFR